jgi:hypothetical protein
MREDSDDVDRLDRMHEEAVIPVWHDTAELWPGEDWRARIRPAVALDLVGQSFDWIVVTVGNPHDVVASPHIAQIPQPAGKSARTGHHGLGTPEYVSLVTRMTAMSTPLISPRIWIPTGWVVF